MLQRISKKKVVRAPEAMAKYALRDMASAALEAEGIDRTARVQIQWNGQSHEVEARLTVNPSTGKVGLYFGDNKGWFGLTDTDGNPIPCHVGGNISTGFRIPTDELNAVRAKYNLGPVAAEDDLEEGESTE